MKPILSVLIILNFTFFCSFAQNADITNVMELSGNYVENKYDKGSQNTLDLGFSYGRAISRSFSVGLGLQYVHQKTNEMMDFLIPTQQYLIIFKTRSQTTGKVFEPSLFLKYNYPVTNRLFFSTRMSVFAGFAHQNVEGLSAMSSHTDTPIVIEDPIGVGLITWDSERDNTYFGFSVQPELSYYLNDHIGILLKLGGIRYDNYKFENHNWIVSFNPVYWSYGFCIAFGDTNSTK